MFIYSNKARHSFLRRVMNPSFSQSSLKNIEPTMNRHYNCFLEGISQQASQNDGIVELNAWFHNLTLDISGALIFGVDFDSLKTGQQHFSIKALHGAFRILSALGPIPWAGVLLKVIPPPKFVKETRDKFTKVPTVYVHFAAFGAIQCQ